MTDARILVAEDEAAIATLIQYNLKQANFHVDVAENGADALKAVKQNAYDLVLLDWMLPDLSGLDICKELRLDPKTETLPVIMVTARGEEEDRVKGLDSGADDYIVKPFSPAELIARVKALLRRSGGQKQGSTLSFDDITLDLIGYKVQRSSQDIHLGPTEFKLLKHLMESPGTVFSREDLLDAVWEKHVHVEVRTVDVHIRRLRKALNQFGGHDVVRTVRSAGYALDQAR